MMAAMKNRNRIVGRIDTLKSTIGAIAKNPFEMEPTETIPTFRKTAGMTMKRFLRQMIHMVKSASTTHQPDEEVKEDDSDDGAQGGDYYGQPHVPKLGTMHVAECFIYLHHLVEQEVSRTQLEMNEVIARLRGEFIQLNSSQNFYQIE